MTTFKPILFSAIQPSGNLTIGNYIGTMRYWSEFQDNYECLFCIADLHALTTLNKSFSLKKSVLDTLALYLACGVDPKKSIIFIQSHVYQHSQLHWILSCFSQFSELSRMTQFKNKKRTEEKNINENISTGLFNYPVLMSADILLYRSNLVPVGKDQIQHLELTRNIANRFNLLYGDIFTLPDAFIPKNGAKIMSLLNPMKKMSKSDINKNNVIFLLEDISSIFFKIKNAMTDSEIPPKIYYDVKKKSGISNLLEILSSITNKDIPILEKEFKGIMYSEFKNVVFDNISKFLEKLQKSYLNYRSDESYLKKIAKEGAIKARLKSEKILKNVFSAVGID